MNVGETRQIGTLGIFPERDGMRTVKCFGSSKAFAARMKNVPGVYGVTTYGNRFAVVVYYDLSETSKEKVENAMFTPVKRKLNTPCRSETIKKITLGVENYSTKWT